MNKEFIKLNKSQLINLFKERYKELADQSVMEPDTTKKILLSERALENKNWQNLVEGIDEQKSKKNFTGV
jgi:hypothetical protein